ncbi:bifunctional riboflavin kinase/FAD synthetase [Bergeyella zoohelcum]|uniref:Riboflavin biosynthesis protein n=1 Tax=Bergeyella zoohelcum TaxID=1015 RepID=A0A7Z9CGH7_9FLAO|nr:bifunctional riboflavin kinase/FAD synthetase [Bergeyella zoohelcum]VDH04945.1 bifunctional riboflavin kinase/FMN adenylyltransferase [Bergeyella zoohelcum]
MKIFRDYKEFSAPLNTALSIGMFDGVHIGHTAIIQRIVEKAKTENLSSTLLTFEPHPRLFFNPQDPLKHLTLQDEKIELFRKSGVDNVIFQPFDQNFSQLSGKEFIQNVVVHHLKAKHIVIGHDHVFGKNKSGNFELLENLATKYQYTLEKAHAMEVEGEIVSSTKIRNALLNGEIKKANNLLGYNYFFSGKIVHGKKLGRTIGYPTANIFFKKNKLLPQFGAYIVEVYLGDDFYPGMLSIGNNPTFDGQEVSAEVYILGFSGNIYGKELKVVFRDFLHEQIKFPSVDGLIQCLDEDKRKTEMFFEQQ